MSLGSALHFIVQPASFATSFWIREVIVAAALDSEWLTVEQTLHGRIGSDDANLRHSLL
jgi:hypothetical protein